MDGTLRFAVDRRVGLISVEGSGFWTVAATIDHFERLETAICSVRAERGSVRVLVDLRDSVAQAQDVAEIVRDATGRIYTPADYIALVIRPGLSAMQMLRLTKALNARTFDDPVAAIRWLEHAGV